MTNTGSEEKDKTISSIGIGTSNTDRKNAFEVMENGDMYVYGVGDYDGTNAVTENADGVIGTPLQAAISHNTNRIQVVNVNNTPYKSIKVEANGEERKSFNRLNADILFNLNCDAKTLYENKDKLYVTLSKYSNLRKKQSVINDVIKSDERLKVYCWIENYNNDPIGWTYVYTLDHFNDSPDDLVHYDPHLFVKRRPYCTERNQGSEFYNNNYATYLNELINSGLYASDYHNLKRYPEGDIDKYFVGDITANPIAKWASDCYGNDEDLDELIYHEKPYFFAWLSSKCIRSRGNEPYSSQTNYCYITYVGDYPIYPVKLADCKVIVFGDVLHAMSENGQQYIKLSDLSLEQLEKLPQITLVLPFTTNHIIGRLYLPRNDDFTYRNPEILDVDTYKDSNKIGGTKRLCGMDENTSKLKTYFKLGICNEVQLRTNNFRDIPQYDFQLLTYGNANVMYWFDWDGEWRTAMITKVI